MDENHGGEVGIERKGISILVRRDRGAVSLGKKGILFREGGRKGSSPPQARKGRVDFP